MPGLESAPVTASEIDARPRPPQRLAGCGARAARRSSCMLLDDAFLYEIRGYMSSQKRASVYSCGLLGLFLRSPATVRCGWLRHPRARRGSCYGGDDLSGRCGDLSRRQSSPPRSQANPCRANAGIGLVDVRLLTLAGPIECYRSRCASLSPPPRRNDQAASRHRAREQTCLGILGISQSISTSPRRS